MTCLQQQPPLSDKAHPTRREPGCSLKEFSCFGSSNSCFHSRMSSHRTGQPFHRSRQGSCLLWPCCCHAPTSVALCSHKTSDIAQLPFPGILTETESTSTQLLQQTELEIVKQHQTDTACRHCFGNSTLQPVLHSPLYAGFGRGREHQ